MPPGGSTRGRAPLFQRGGYTRGLGKGWDPSLPTRTPCSYDRFLCRFGRPEAPMRHTLAHFRKLRESGEKIVMLTSYDSSFAALCEAAGVEILLVGDSLGMVVQGHDSTLPVTMEEMAYHVACVARGSR